MIQQSFRVRGPLFTGELHAAVRNALPDIEKQVAQDGVDYMLSAPGRTLIGAPFKRPTGFYRMHIAAKLKGLHFAIHDHGVIYGPWLAGVSARNAASRFKGYAHWRRTLQYLMKFGGVVAAEVLAIRLRRLGR